ncbi:hypothetical protein DFH09DRAFT_982079 [Mycena vulgaris]|nr:hypothetical protein DFH09DRAFT_982079 [Mycena vulgaris]
MDAADSEPEIESQEDCTRVNDLWFADHGLVLRAGNRLFRVSGGILAARSSVFRDMMSIPQPESQPLIDGCPVVVLHDSAVDAEYFLRAIFDSSFFEPPPTPTTFHIVAGVLRLSTKYDVEYLRRRALLHISAVSPVSPKEQEKLINTPNCTFDFRSRHFQRLLLVHSLSLTWALPAAMYAVSCQSVSTIIDGIVCDGIHVQLPHSLQRACLIARATLATAQSDVILRFLHTRPSPAACLSSTCDLYRHTVLGSLLTLEPPRPFGLIHHRFQETVRAGLCNPCFLSADAEHRAARQNLWDSLPAMYELPPWEELTAARATDLS